jgi:hypothetical protein
MIQRCGLTQHPDDGVDNHDAIMIVNLLHVVWAESHFARRRYNTCAPAFIWKAESTTDSQFYAAPK